MPILMIPLVLLILSGIILSVLIPGFVREIELKNRELYLDLGQPDWLYFITAKWITHPKFLFCLIKNPSLRGVGRHGHWLYIIAVAHILSWAIGFFSSLATFLISIKMN